MRLSRLILLLFSCALMGAETLPIPRRLNNLVVEVFNLSGADARGIQSIRFTMPHDGWVYLSARGNPKSDERLFVSFDEDTNDRRGLYLNKSAPSGERQSLLSAGEHTLQIHRSGSAELDQLILRRVPELSFSKFGATPRTLSAGDHDWDFLSQYFLPHLNTIVGMEAEQSLPFVRQWKSRGGRWLVEVPRAMDPARSFGFQNPHVDGVLIDEFAPGLEVPRYSTDKEVRLYFVDQSEGAIEFASVAIAAGHKIVWEKYLGEVPPDLDEQSRLDRDLGKWMAALKRDVPNVIEHSVVCLGFFSAPPLTLNRDPAVDYKVWMDRQFQYIATNSAFLGLRAIMEYQTRNADEESLRWSGLLYRHYALEGKTNLLSDEFGFRYRLGHIQNPDFRRGLRSWTTQPTNATATFESAPQLGLLQGRFPYNEYWDGALCVYGTNGSVEISQTISNLNKGRQYSAKLISVRKNDLVATNSEAAFHPIELRIAGATALPENFSRDVIPSPRPPFNSDKPLWIDYQRIVFHADQESARLTINVSQSDSPLLINFVEVQPYLFREARAVFQSTSP